MASLLGYGKSDDRISVTFDGDAQRPRRRLSPNATPAPVFAAVEPVTGVVEIRVPAGKRLEHQGIKIECVGQIELFHDRGTYYDFTCVLRELDVPGVLMGQQRYAFDMSHAEKPYESYNGLNVRLRYFVRVTVTRGYASSLIKEQEFVVQVAQPAPETNTPVKMEVGIEECLHIEFEYDKSKYHLADVVVGKVYFLLVRIKIKHMELAVIRREAAGAGPNQHNESETITKYEVMDGAPVRGECVPIRLFLRNFNLTPTYRGINNKFSVRYYLNLVLVDQEERRYFKQQEITLYRAAE